MISLRFLIIALMVYSNCDQAPLIASEPVLKDAIFMPQTSYRIAPVKKQKITVSGSISNSDQNDFDDNDRSIDIDAKYFSPSKIFGYDMEIALSEMSHMGVLLDLEIPDESQEEARKKGHLFRYSVRMGGFYRLFYKGIQGISPFLRLGGSVGVNLGSGEFGGNSFRADGAGGLIWYFSEFFGVELGYGYGYEIMRFFGSFKGGKPSSNLTAKVLDRYASFGFKTTFW